MHENEELQIVLNDEIVDAVYRFFGGLGFARSFVFRRQLQSNEKTYLPRERDSPTIRGCGEREREEIRVG